MIKPRTAKQNSIANGDYDDMDITSLLGLNDQYAKRRRYSIKGPEIFYLYDEIGPIGEYVDMIHSIIGAEEGDEIHIRLASPGGNLDTMVALLHAMGQCKGTIITHADSEIASAATWLFLAGDVPMIYPYSTFMFHNASGGFYGKVQETMSRVHSMERLVGVLMEDYLSPFFTETEIADMKNGKDFYFDAQEMVDRISAHQDIVNSELEEKEKATKPKPPASRRIKESDKGKKNV